MQAGRPLRRIERDYPQLSAAVLYLHEAHEDGDAGAGQDLLFALRCLKAHERRVGGTPLPAALGDFLAAPEEVCLVSEGRAQVADTAESVEVERLVIDYLIVAEVKSDPEAGQPAAAQAVKPDPEAAPQVLDVVAGKKRKAACLQTESQITKAGAPTSGLEEHETLFDGPFTDAQHRRVLQDLAVDVFDSLVSLASCCDNASPSTRAGMSAACSSHRERLQSWQLARSADYGDEDVDFLTAPNRALKKLLNDLASLLVDVHAAARSASELPTGHKLSALIKDVRYIAGGLKQLESLVLGKR